MPRTKRSEGARSLKLKAADTFALIRWLARSQSDPRKAVAELVQNSLDAEAKRIDIRRLRVRGKPALTIRDDGVGVLPEMAREDALNHLATHVGSSRKLGLDAHERARHVVAGKYGVGLLGFWSIGHFLELRSRVAGSPLLALRLEEDSPQASILNLPLRTDDPETFTEIAVLELHETASKILGGRRLTDYLAAELRGQILRSGVELTIHDAIARGTAQKQFSVVPRRFTGEPLQVPAELEVAGHAPIRIELYHAPGAEHAAIQVAAAGTLVADDIKELATLGLDEPPWTGHELTGLVDFADFSVPPGTRRGVTPDRAAQAFAMALESLRPLVFGELARLAEERQRTADREVVRDLQRALRGFHRRLPQYDLPRVEGGTIRDLAAPPGAAVSEPADAIDTETDERESPSLFPPGALARVRIVPPVVRVAPGGEHRVRAIGEDAGGRRLGEVACVWSVEDRDGSGASVIGEGARPAIVVAPWAPFGAVATLAVMATHDGHSASAEARIEVAEMAPGASPLGIPEPNLVSDADGAWRSRMVQGRWEVNDAHEDYVALRSSPRTRLRYLLTLLAKEIVLRSGAPAEDASSLESMIEILAHIEQNLRGS